MIRVFQSNPIQTPLGKGQVRSQQWIKDANLRLFQADEQVAVVNFELDVPAGMDYSPHKVAIQVVDKDIMAKAHSQCAGSHFEPQDF